MKQSSASVPGGVYYKRINISRFNRLRKADSHRKNLQARAEINRARSHNPVGCPTFHGQGYHALEKVRQQKRRASFLRKTGEAK